MKTKTNFDLVVSKKKIFALLLVAFFFGMRVPEAKAIAADAPSDVTTIPSVAEKALGEANLPFVANEGQIGNDTVKYYVNTFAGNVFVTDSGLRYSITKKTEDKTSRGPRKTAPRAAASDTAAAPTTEGVAFDEQFLDQNNDPISYDPQGEDPSDIPVSYFQGSNPDNWKQNVKNYGSLSLGEPWQGIEVRLKAHGKNIEKIFTVAPGANPGEIAVGFEGIDNLAIQDDGTLKIITSVGDVSMTAPVAYQLRDDGSRQTVKISYDVRSGNRYEFSVGEYDHARPLIIDPLLGGTFLGTGSEELYSISLDSNGNVFVAGTTAALDFPVTAGVLQPTYGTGSDDFYITKFKSDLTGPLLASTYLGGSGRSFFGVQIKVASSGDVYMAGSSRPTAGSPIQDYPTTNGSTCVVPAGQYCPVVSKLSNDLTNLEASTYVGSNAQLYGMDIDSNGKVFITGYTRNTTFPTTAGTYKPDYGNDPAVAGEAFVSRLDADLNLEASTFVGGGEAFSIKVDPNDNVFIAGYPTYAPSYSVTYPTTSGAYDTVDPSDTKYFISKLSNDLAQLNASTFLGGSNGDLNVYGSPNMLQLDSSGNVYITDSTNDSTYPTTLGAYQQSIQTAGDWDLVVSKLDNDLHSLLASTFLGGTGYEESEGALAIDSLGNVFTAAYTLSLDFPTTPGAYSRPTCTPAATCYNNYTVSKLSSDLSTLAASTYIETSSGDGMDGPYALAFDAVGYVYVGGTALTNEFPTLPGDYQIALVGNTNGAIAKFDNDLRLGGIIAPTITTGATPTKLTATSATLHATLTDSGGEIPTVTIKWGTQIGNLPNICSPVTHVGNVYSCDLTGLTASTTYYVQASATNNGGTGDGSEVSFRTKVAGIASTSISTGFTENGTGLFVGPDGFSRLLFLDNNNNLTYARCTDADCINRITNVVESNASWALRPGSSLLTSGSDGFARIVYAKPDNSLWVYTCLDNDCSATTSHQIADGANGPGSYGVEITRGPEGFPRIAFFDGWGGNANHFVRCLDADCASFNDTVFGGQHLLGMANISLSIGTDGFARIVYPQSTDILEYARCTDADCTTPVITTIVSDPGNPNYPYIYPGNYGVVVRMGSDGFARIAYLNQDNALHYVTCSDPDCTAKSDVTVTTDAFGSINGFGLAIRGGNLASIAYSGNSDGYLHLINCTNVTCSTSDNIMVDSTDPSGDFWKGISLVVDSNNLPRMLYVDAGTIGARYAYFSSPASAVTPPTITTDTPASVTSTSATLQATLTSDGGEAPSAVELKWGTVSGSLNTCAPVTNVGSTYTCNLSGLTAAATYYFQASATNSAGTGTSSEVSFQTTATEVIIPPADPVTDPTPLAITDKECKPMDLSVKLQTDGKIKLSWKKPCDAIDKIEIERKFDKGTFEKIDSVDKSKHTYLDDGATLAKGKYTYRISGHRRASGKNSDHSDEASVTLKKQKNPATVASDKTTSTDTVVPTPTSVEIPQPQPTPELPPSPTTSTFSDSSSPQKSVPKTNQVVQKTAAKITKLVFPGLVAGASTANDPSAIPLVATGLVTLALAGLATGAATASASTAIPLFGTSPAPLSEAASRIFGIIGFIGKKKREDDWGIVFDSQTKQPLRGVTISIIDEGGHVVDVSTSDSQGRYGFLPKPGNYTLAIVKKTYELETTKMEDILYGQLYTGQAIKIEGSDMKKINIELKTKAINWQDFAQRKIAAYTSVFSIVKRDFFLILFYAGFAVNLGIAFLYPTTLNIVFFVAYLAMLTYYSFFKKKSYGLVTNTQTSQPVPFAMLSIYDAKDAQRRVAFAVSDVLGRYFMFAKNGSYLLKASGNFLGGNHFEKMVPIEIKDGIVRSDVKV